MLIQLQTQLVFEHKKEWDTFGTYNKFARCVQKNRDELIEILKGLKADGKCVAAYIAPAKGNNLAQLLSDWHSHLGLCSGKGTS
ncbi:MAG: hypothetical protein V3V70_05700 [Candidatus Scalindua sp.]